MLKKTSFLSYSALLCAGYAVLTLALAPISYGAVQFRIAEALCVLPFLFPKSKTGLTAGCFLANLIGLFLGITVLPDVFTGTLATGLSAILTSKVKSKWLAPLPPVICNGLIIGATLCFSMTDAGARLPFFLYSALTVALGEAVVCYGLGIPLISVFSENRKLRNLILRLKQF